MTRIAPLAASSALAACALAAGAVLSISCRSRGFLDDRTARAPAAEGAKGSVAVEAGPAREPDARSRPNAAGGAGAAAGTPQPAGADPSGRTVYRPQVPGMALAERGDPVLVVLRGATETRGAGESGAGARRIETGVLAGIDGGFLRLLGNTPSLASDAPPRNRRAGPAAEPGAARLPASFASFVSQSGNVTSGRVLSEDHESVTVVDAACSVVTLTKARLDPARVFLHGRSLQAPVFPRSLEGALQAAWFDALAGAARAAHGRESMRAIAVADVVSVVAAGEFVAFRALSGPRVEGRVLEVHDGCLLLDVLGVGRRALPLAAVDSSTFSPAADPRRSSNEPAGERAGQTARLRPLAPVADWPGLAEFVRGRGYVRLGPFVAFDKPRVAQGFRLRVSATPASAEAVASVVLPLLVARGVPHSAFARVEEYEAARAGAQRGKFITVFPRDEASAAELARAIDAALAPLHPPFWSVAGERAIGRLGIVSARYAPFTYERGGKLRRPDGGLENDTRLDDWKPQWARDPFGG